MRIKDLRQLERDDLNRRAKVAREEDAALRRAERLERRRVAWPKWVAFWERRAQEITTAAKVAGGTATILAALFGAVKHSAAGWQKAKRAWSFYAGRDVGKAEQPPPSGGASTALDRVERPAPPGSPRTVLPPTKD